MTTESISVLIVDDSKIMRQIIAKRLREMGFVDIFEASGVQMALEIVAEGKIKLILSDLSMPGLTGMEFLKMVRSSEATRNLPFVLLTAEAQLYSVLTAYREGVSQYVTKPFTKEYFAYIIDKVIRENYGPEL
ncbi:MAG: response regulator [Proteobacteria bacterium]|nr:response regulator [Pseudomonadota bacterium]MBU1640326.1 response regulator [Pseudomonadota bacterium]